MMKINKIFWAVAGIASLGLLSCSKASYEEYTPAQKEAGSQVYFEAGAATTYNLKDYADCYFEIPVRRVDASSAATISLDVVADEAFTIAKTVEFEAGEDASSVKVSWDKAKIVEAKDYTVELQILDETTKYGNDKYSFKCSMPASWTKLYTGHVYEVCWAEDYDVTMYYQDTEFENIRYCMLKDAWNDISGDEPVPMADYYFYWNTKTNVIYVPHQSIGYYSSSASAYVYTGDAAAFYNAWQSYGHVCPSAEYFTWSEGFNSRNEFNQGYYDGNGGFYLADWLYLAQDGVPTGRGYQFGGDPDYFIADGFVRTTDFNDDDHIGASEPLFTGDVTSMFFSQDNETPYEFTSGLRYTAVEDPAAETTTYYLADYFTDDHCLAFTAPVPIGLEPGAAITDVENDQNTGCTVFGNEIWVSVKGGSIDQVIDGDDTTVVFSINLKVYCKDAEGNKTYDFGTMTENFTPTGVLRDEYTMDDIYGDYFKNYLGTWRMNVSDYFNNVERTYDVQILDGGDNTFKIVNLAGFGGSLFADTLTASYNPSYGILSLPSQTLNAQYEGNDVKLAMFDKIGYFFSTREIWAGKTDEGVLAFVNVYTTYNTNGVFYYYGTNSGLCAIYDIYSDAPDALPSKLIMNKRTEYVTDDGFEGQPVSSFTKISGATDKVTSVKTFSLQPVQKKSGRTEMPAPSAQVAL